MGKAQQEEPSIQLDEVKIFTPLLWALLPCPACLRDRDVCHTCGDNPAGHGTSTPAPSSTVPVPSSTPPPTTSGQGGHHNYPACARSASASIDACMHADNAAWHRAM